MVNRIEHEVELARWVEFYNMKIEKLVKKRDECKKELEVLRR